MFQTIGIIGKVSDARFVATLRRLVLLLRQRNIQPLVEAAVSNAVRDLELTAVSREVLGETADLVVVIGGDGTLLRAARALIEYETPLLGVNLGHVGFMADIAPDEISTQMSRIIDGDYQQESRFLIAARIMRKGQPIWHSTATNECVVHTSDIARLIEFRVYVNHQPVSQQRADGIITATPTGSTAYALSAGGPIMHPSLGALVIVHISPHTLSSRPLVLPADSRIEIELSTTRGEQAQVTCDGQQTHPLCIGDRILIHQLKTPLQLLHPSNYNYFGTLHTKLCWGTVP